jgi:hypothetical protein
VRKSSRALIALSTGIMAAVAGGVWWSQAPTDKQAAQRVVEQERLVRPLAVPTPLPEYEPPATADEPTAALGSEDLPKPNTQPLVRADAGVQHAQPVAPALPDAPASPRNEPTSPQPRIADVADPRPAPASPKKPKLKPTAADPFQASEPKPVPGRGSIKVSMDQFGLSPDAPRTKP